MSLEALRLRPRLVLSCAIAATVGFLLPAEVPLWSRGLTGWDVGVTVYIALVVWEMSRASIERIMARASKLDDTAPVILTISIAATVASVGAILALLLASTSSSKAGDIGLAAATMALSWCFTQVVFAVHYTHIYYGDEDGVPRGGLEFGGKDDQPDFWDFLYFTSSVGAAAQTSDTLVCSKRMRRTVLAHSVYSFFFNTAVLAFAINIGAGLAGH